MVSSKLIFPQGSFSIPCGLVSASVAGQVTLSIQRRQCRKMGKKRGSEQMPPTEDTSGALTRQERIRASMKPR